jgi:hypothetical protein
VRDVSAALSDSRLSAAAGHLGASSRRRVHRVHGSGAESPASQRSRVAYWVSISVFLVLALGAGLMATLAPLSMDSASPEITRVESTETSHGADGVTTTVERRETTTGSGGSGNFLGLRLHSLAIGAIQLIVGLLGAYLIAGLIHRVVCGHYTIKMGPVELPDAGHATQFRDAADAASQTVDQRRVLAEDTKAREEEASRHGVRPSSEPVDEPDIEFRGEDMVFGLRDLSISLASALRELLSPPSRRPIRNSEDMVDILLTRGVLPNGLADAVGRVLYQCRIVGAGPTRVRIDDAAMAYGPQLLTELRALRTTAARALERHVLGQLERLPNYTVHREAEIGHTQVDAIVCRNGRQVIVEVRARVGPGATAAVGGLHDWLNSLQTEMPILLIIPAQPTPSSLWQEIGSRPNLGVLVWDEQCDGLASRLNQLLRHHDVAPGS